MTTPITRGQILYKSGWSPLEGETLHSAVVMTFVNGNPVYREGRLMPAPLGKALEFAPE
jgi:dihydroorotase